MPSPTRPATVSQGLEVPLPRSIAGVKGAESIRDRLEVRIDLQVDV